MSAKPSFVWLRTGKGWAGRFTSANFSRIDCFIDGSSLRIVDPRGVVHESLDRPTRAHADRWLADNIGGRYMKARLSR